MLKSSLSITKTICQAGLLVCLLIFVIFVASLSREVHQLKDTPEIHTIVKAQTDTLNSVDKALATLLILPEIIKVNNELHVVIDKDNQTYKAKPLKNIALTSLVNITFSIISLILIAILIPSLGALYERRKTDRTLSVLSRESDDIISFYQSNEEKPKGIAPIAKLDWSLKLINKLTREHHEKIEQYVYRDKLTQLTDRHTFLEHLQKQVEIASQKNQKIALLFIDLDGFKQVNDSFGHSFGDEVLIQVAERLKSIVRSQNLNYNAAEGSLEYNLARLGGDEFTILIQELASNEDAIDISNQILKEIERDFILGNKVVKIGSSIGIAVYPESASSPNALLQMADVAMYRAKTDGRGIYRIYSPEMGHKVRRYHYLLEELRLAIASNGFSLSFQPIIKIDDCSINYFEALIRWNHPVEGSISPAEFIPIAEESNLILELGDWIMEEACRQMAAWYNAGMKKVSMSVNVSGIQLKHRPLHDWIMEILEKVGLPPTALMIEITESCFIEAAESTINELEKLRSSGVKIAIDDFGTGFSSLSYLANLPVDTLKIDRMFITEAQENVKYHKILQSINELASKLDLKVVAEGVEYSEQFEMLRELGVDHIQGYFISRPETSHKVGVKVLSQSMNHIAMTGTGIWRPEI